MPVSHDPKTMTSLELLRFLLAAEIPCDLDDLEIVVTDGHWIIVHLNQDGEDTRFKVVVGSKLDTPELFEGNIIDTQNNRFHREIGYYNLRDWRDVTSLVSAGMALAWISYGIALIEQGPAIQTEPLSIDDMLIDEAPF